MCKLESDGEREKGKEREIDFANYQVVNLAYGEIQQPLIKLSALKRDAKKVLSPTTIEQSKPLGLTQLPSEAEWQRMKLSGGQDRSLQKLCLHTSARPGGALGLGGFDIWPKLKLLGSEFGQICAAFRSIHVTFTSTQNRSFSPLPSRPCIIGR